MRKFILLSTLFILILAGCTKDTDPENLEHLEYLKHQEWNKSSKENIWNAIGIEVKIEEIIGKKAVCKIIKNSKLPWVSPAINDVTRILN